MNSMAKVDPLTSTKFVQKLRELNKVEVISLLLVVFKKGVKQGQTETNRVKRSQTESNIVRQSHT